MMMNSDPSCVGLPVMVRARSVIALAAVWLAGVSCAARKPVIVSTPPLEDVGERGLDREALARDLEISIRESYASLSGGYDEAYLDGLARDRRLVLIDVGPEDVLVGFDARACTMRQQFEDRQVEILPKRLEVHVTPDGTAGWSFDELSYRTLHEGRRVIIPMRSTGVYERRNGRWLLVQEHVSYGVPDDELWTYAARGHTGTPAPLENWTSPGEAATQARALLEKAAAGEKGTAALLDDNPDTLVIGSDPDGEWRGAEAIAHGSLRALYGEDKSFTVRDLRVKTSATEQLAWAAANVVVGATVEGEPATLPVRVTWVLEKKGAGWRVVQIHTSVPVPSSELALRVFGTTTAMGAGTVFTY
jgi:ketosteroid isomerase-like protein